MLIKLNLNLRISQFVYILINLFISKKFQNRVLSTWAMPKQRTFLESILFKPIYSTWIKFKYLKELDPDKRESMKKVCMAGDAGKAWAEYYAEEPIDFNLKVGDILFSEAYPMYKELPKYLSNSLNNVKLIHVGSSSGKELSYFAKKYPQVECLGIDICEDILEVSLSRYKSQNCNFNVGSVLDIERFLDDKKENIIFSSCSLQYLQPEHLKKFFLLLSKYSNIVVVLTETGNKGVVSPDQLENSEWVGSFCYNHNYKKCAEESGFITVSQKIILPYSNIDQSNTCHYFYEGRLSK